MQKYHKNRLLCGSNLTILLYGKRQLLHLLRVTLYLRCLILCFLGQGIWIWHYFLCTSTMCMSTMYARTNARAHKNTLKCIQYIKFYAFGVTESKSDIIFDVRVTWARGQMRVCTKKFNARCISISMFLGSRNPNLKLFHCWLYGKTNLRISFLDTKTLIKIYLCARMFMSVLSLFAHQKWCQIWLFLIQKTLQQVEIQRISSSF